MHVQIDGHFDIGTQNGKAWGICEQNIARAEKIVATPAIQQYREIDRESWAMETRKCSPSEIQQRNYLIKVLDVIWNKMLTSEEIKELSEEKL